MRNTWCLLLSMVMVFACLAPPSATADTGNPSDLFLKAYMAAQQGERFAEDGRFREARSRLRFAASLLDQVATDHPDWQSLIVDYRARRVAESLYKVEERLALDQVAADDYELPSGQTGAVVVAPVTIRRALPVDADGFDVENPEEAVSEEAVPEDVLVEEVDGLPMPEAGATVRVDGGESERLRARIRELMTELQQAQIALQNRPEPVEEERVRELEAEREALQKALVEQRTELEAKLEEERVALQETMEEQTTALQTRLEEEKEALEKRLEEAVARVEEEKITLEERLAEQEAAAKQAQGELEEAKTALETELKAVQEVLAEQETASEEQKLALAKALEEMEASTELVETLTVQVEQTRQELAESQAVERALREEFETGNASLLAEKRELAERLTQSNLQLASLALERDDLELELAAARDEIADLRETAKQVETLEEDNRRLLARLEEFETRFDNLQNDPEQVHRQLEQAHAEVRGLREELEETKLRNAESLEAIDLLRDQLDALNRELTIARVAEGDSEEARRMVSENQLLREIVLRQLREERRRSEASQLLMAEVMKLENRSDILMAKLEEVTRPIITLSEEERSLFREPTITISDEQFDTMAVSIALNKPMENPVAPFLESLDASIERAEADGADLGEGGGELQATPQRVSQTVRELEESEAVVAVLALDGEESAVGVVEGVEVEVESVEEAQPGGGPLVQTGLKPRVPSELVPVAEEARRFFELGQYRQAEQAYERILARAPDNLYALSNLGVVQFRDGRIRLAELTLKKATTLSPEDAFAHTTLGIVYFQLGKYDDAIEVLTKSIMLDPRNPQAHNYLGITADMKGWPEAAEEEIQKAIALNPDYADAHFNLAVVYAKQDPPMRELARRHYDRAIALGSPPDPLLERLIQ